MAANHTPSPTYSFKEATPCTRAWFSGPSTAAAASTASVGSGGNPGVYAEFITHGYFSIIALNFADTTSLDHRIADQLHRDPRYHTIDVVPYGIEVPPIGKGTYVIWRYEPKS